MLVAPAVGISKTARTPFAGLSDSTVLKYLPLALAFLSTQFRMALVAREANLKSTGQVIQHFTKLGVPMWQSRISLDWGIAASPTSRCTAMDPSRRSRRRRATATAATLAR